MSLTFDAPISALERFFAKLAVDPCHGFEGTACVLWTGAQTCGQGKHIKYPAFWYEGARWYAHRWAAKHIHGQQIDNMEVDHGCRRPLCVNHLRAMPPTINRELQWIRVQVGIEENPREQFVPDDFPVPFYAEPEWYRALKGIVG